MKSIIVLSISVMFLIGIMTGRGTINREPASFAGESWATAYLNVINDLVEQHGD